MFVENGWWLATVSFTNSKYFDNFIVIQPHALNSWKKKRQLSI